MKIPEFLKAFLWKNFGICTCSRCGKAFTNVNKAIQHMVGEHEPLM